MMASEERFAKEWQRYNEILPEYEGQFRKWIGPLGPNDFRNRVVLDAGCGNGRNSYWMLKFGAKRVLAFDHDRKTVEVAKKNLEDFKNATVFYESIYSIPFRNKVDLAIAIGVVHHLESPEKAIYELVKATKHGGKIVLWLYGYEGNELTIFAVNTMRIITRHLPPRLVWLLALVPAVLVFLGTRLINFRHPYLRQLKTLTFPNIHSIVFDQLLPRIAKYYRKTEAVSLLRTSKIKDVKIYRVNGNSWVVIGVKK